MGTVTTIASILCLSFWVFCNGADATCDRELANSIAMALRDSYDAAFTEYTSDHTLSPAAMELCLNTLQENTIEAKYKAAIRSCDEGELLNVKLTWNITIVDIIQFCRDACPRYEQLLVCSEGIELKATQSYQFEKFCSSFNSSLQCAMAVLDSCGFDQTFYYKLVKPYAIDIWNNMCLSGCSNLDVSVRVIAKDCWGYMTNLMNSRFMDEKCRWFLEVHECLANNTEKCEQTEDLLAFQYPPYRSIGKLCLATTTTSSRITTVAADDEWNTTTVAVPEKISTPVLDTKTDNTTTATSTGNTTEHVKTPEMEEYVTTKANRNNDGGYVYDDDKFTSAKESGLVESKPVESSASSYPTEILYYSMSALVIACIALIGVICLVCIHLQNRHHRTWHTGEPRPDIEIEATKEHAINDENGKN